MPVNEISHGSLSNVDGKKFREMLYTALAWLKEQQSFIDSLNVFPVPDGDTGTNMYLTFLEAIKEVKKIETNNVSEITSAMAKGALMGARGNSGVILSQLLRGFSQANEANSSLTATHLVKALRKASDVAYQGVLKPVEGTILTVSRKAAEGAELALENNLDINGIMENTVAAARDALNKTPEQLPILKEAGVVDAGGQGYLIILEGLLKGLNSEYVPQGDLEVVKPSKKEQQIAEDIKYAYCTQALINLQKDTTKSIEEIRNDLQHYGDSLMVVGSDRTVKIHIHTNHPGIILEYGLKLGSLIDINIDNMKIQSAEKVRQTEEQQRQEFMPAKKKGIIAVGKGDGIKEIFKDLGIDVVIDGGQSMNPSTNDFLEAINNLNSSEIIILPNNKNIISAAEQAASLSDKDVVVIPTKTIPQAVSSMMVFNDEADLDELKEAMEMETENVTTLEITRAVKSSKVNGHNISTGDVIGLENGQIEAVGKEYQDVIVELLKKVCSGDEFITIFYGEEINEDEAGDLVDTLEEEFNFEDIELYRGGQPLYPYIISVE
ncbi:DAK2 domain-containing protein [Halothermothrix orenii]|uniref:Dak phosphatase n=1 Tax=Halothermothrix orenii (strain H 168 / OCM 544 / DSM 9562) TaxID=373903 RepID=B8CWU7_HALOH|nr:DAK2 domain-containing protein [Halothermothrix orenii]ACL69766.1 Dak phosphatase [Halothermothrix orenii H 168]